MWSTQHGKLRNDKRKVRLGHELTPRGGVNGLIPLDRGYPRTSFLSISPRIKRISTVELASKHLVVVLITDTPSPMPPLHLSFNGSALGHPRSRAQVRDMAKAALEEQEKERQKVGLQTTNYH